MRFRSVTVLVCVVAGIVALAGAVLIRINVLRNREVAQATAQELTVKSVDALSRQLGVLSDVVREAEARIPRNSEIQQRGPAFAFGYIRLPEESVLLQISNARIIRSAPAGRDSAEFAAFPFDEWDSSTPSAQSLLEPQPIPEGPVRLSGGRWGIYVRLSLRNATRSSRDWLVAARTVDSMVNLAGLDRLPHQGFDFQLSYRDPESGQSYPFASSSDIALDSPVERSLSNLQTPWTLSIAPHDGWFPWNSFLVHCALVLLFVLLAGILTGDLARRPALLQRELDTRERRLQAANDKLMQEIQQREEIEKQFSHASFHDALTGLPNRIYFVDRLDRALRRSRRLANNHLAIVVLNFDRFKSINEGLGHAAGDELLVQAVQRFENCLRPDDVVIARFGGDELAFLVQDIQTVDAATIVAQRLQTALKEPFAVARQSVYVTASMGIAVSSMDHDNAEELIRCADIALSNVKAADRGRFGVFDPATRDKVLTLKQLENDLRRAIEQGELLLNFQPIVSFQTGHIAGMEVLVRWQHPLEGMIQPGRFIPLAEESGLIVPLNRWVMRMACQQARLWREMLPEDVTFYLSVNLSARDLRQPDLCDFVAALLQETGLPPGTLRAEITEGSMINDVKSASEVVARLREMGVPLLLDDFGTGYSSLSYLQQFKFDYLKIDQAFVRRVTPSGENLGILRAIVHIAEDLGMQTIAEGIESIEVSDHLRNLGCGYAQGYYFSKPVEAAKAQHLLQSRKEYSVSVEFSLFSLT